MSVVTILGDGGWGTALGILLCRNGHQVTIWGPFTEYVEQTRATGENKAYLPGVPLPASLSWTAVHEDALSGAEIVVFAAPTRYYASVLERVADAVPRDAGLVSVSKGLDRETCRRMTELLDARLPRAKVAALSGPSHAEEVARDMPTAVVIASRTRTYAEALQGLFMRRHFRAYTSQDVVGVELGGALKNVVAVAVGVSDGVGFGDNARAALITRGLAEMARLGRALGADPETFFGLSGMGDLVVTCTSRLSRNRGVGERLGKGETLDKILAGMKQVAEGVSNCGAAHALAERTGIEMPITREVLNMVEGAANPAAAVESLLGREARPEQDL